MFCGLLQMMLTPKDLSFVGYTYKNFEALKGAYDLYGMGLEIFRLHFLRSEISVALMSQCYSA